jgi:hypothetical protein
MAVLTWDNVGERTYETGVDRGVLYIPNTVGVYDNGVSWNGLTSVSESPTGAEANAMYADNIKYLNLYSAEEFGATIEAFTYPDEFAQFDGIVSAGGVSIGQQARKTFGLCYRTRVGNDVSGDDYGYKLHLVYGCKASPSEKAYATVNDSPEALTFSWELSTAPVATNYLTTKPTSLLTIDSTHVAAASLTALEAILYGQPAVNPRLPLPQEVIGLFTTTPTLATPVMPAYTLATKTITIPTTTGVDYQINNVTVPAGPKVITVNTVVTAVPKTGFYFSPVSDDDFFYSIV